MAHRPSLAAPPAPSAVAGVNFRGISHAERDPGCMVCSGSRLEADLEAANAIGGADSLPHFLERCNLHALLKMHATTRRDTMNSVLMRLNPEERARLRELGARLPGELATPPAKRARCV